jgi:hypothetical protein
LVAARDARAGGLITYADLAAALVRAGIDQAKPTLH